MPEKEEKKWQKIQADQLPGPSTTPTSSLLHVEISEPDSALKMVSGGNNVYFMSLFAVFAVIRSCYIVYLLFFIT